MNTINGLSDFQQNNTLLWIISVIRSSHLRGTRKVVSGQNSAPQCKQYISEFSLRFREMDQYKLDIFEKLNVFTKLYQQIEVHITYL